MIVYGIIFFWALQQVIMAYPQAPVEMDIYMELPQGIKTATGNSNDHILKPLKNIYGQKQAGRVWNSFLVDKLTSLGYTSLLIDDCVFFCSEIIFMVYVDDGICENHCEDFHLSIGEGHHQCPKDADNQVF
jgi:hypothetical protein